MKNKNTELIICGSGILEPAVIKAEKECSRIIYRGQISSSDIQKEYQNADVCVIPSLWDEPFGRVVIEAASNACAIIASDKGGIPEIAAVLKIDEIINCTNIELLSMKMDDYCLSTNRIIQLKRIRENINLFSSINNIYNYEKIFRDILNG